MICDIGLYKQETNLKGVLQHFGKHSQKCFGEEFKSFSTYQAAHPKVNTHLVCLSHIKTNLLFYR